MTEVVQDVRFRRIARERVSERVAQEIMKLIAAGTLVPGERLPGERQLAEMMNVSRVSVRAALQQLKSQGFIHAVQGGGTRITAAPEDNATRLMRLVSADTRNFHDLAEIRDGIEVWAARRAAERATPAQIAEIGRELDAMAEAAGSDESMVGHDHAFHLAIAKASGSAVYMHLMEMLSGVLERNIDYHRSTLCVGAEADARLLCQHRRIFEAIRAHDPEAAGEAMHMHLQDMLANYTMVDDNAANDDARLSAE